MSGILLTQNSTPIFKYIVWILGKIMEGIFTVIDAVGVPNIGLAIILFTIIINLLMLPLTIKQQKFAKLSAKMNPELQAIQSKYKNRKDQNSQMAMQSEMQAVYAKYGVSPTGSCGYLLIQMPILFALYRVIYAMPAYVGKIGDTFRVLADSIISADNGAWLTTTDAGSIANTISTYGKSISTNMQNGIVDVLNKLSSSDMQLVADQYNLNGATFDGQMILGADGLINRYNNFLGLNIGDSPQHLIIDAFHSGAWMILVGAVLIPVLAALTQWITVKLMPSQDTDTKDLSDQAAQMQSTMKTMNYIMPLMSAWFCLTLPAGMGIYWIASAVVRGIQQIIINKHIDKMNFDDIIKKNEGKSAKKIAKMKENQERINNYATMSTKNYKSIQQRAKANDSAGTVSSSTESTGKAKPGSMMAKAGMVSEYNKKYNK